MTATPRSAGAPAARDNPDMLVRLARATSSLAHSLAIQIAASASVTLAIATIPWLHDALPGSTPPSAAVTASPTAAAMAPAGAASMPSTFAMAGVAPLAAFPMEGEERFTLSLRRPYVVLASSAWSDGADDGAARQTTMTQANAARAARRRLQGEVTDLAALAPSGPVPAPASAVALPRERPADLGHAVMPYVAEASTDDGMHLARLASLRLPTLPALPSVGEVSARLGSQADEAREAVTHAAGLAADAVGNLLPRF